MSNSSRKKMWEKPWGYIESFWIGMGLILTGIIMQLSFPIKNSHALEFPINIYLLIAYTISLVLLQKKINKFYIVKWLQKIPSSITSIIFVTGLVMIMGIIPQVYSSNKIIQTLGLNKMTTHWSFFLIIFWFLTSLGLVTIKRTFPFKWQNLGFIVNHLGLFIALLTGILGASDIQKLELDLTENKPSWIAENENDKPTELDFAVYLKDFKMEEYPPKLALVNNKTGKVIHNNGKNLFLIKKGESYQYKHYKVEVLEFLKESGRIADKYVRVNEIGSPPSAKLKVINTKTKETIEGWICSGSFRYPYEALKISEEYSFVMTIPDPKNFRSEVDILTKEGQRIPAVLEVNKPFKFKGYNLYQLNYDAEMGKWSQKSTIELVKDPWLPILYLGIFMMIAGAVHMFMTGNNLKLKNNDLD